MAYTTINDPSQYFDTLLWPGNGNSPRTETGLNFQPDWVWHKNRTDSGRSHYLHDSSRGFGAHKELTTNNDHTENSDSHLTENHGYINAATSTGFTIGAGSSSQNYTNRAGANYVAWNWICNGGTTTSVSESGNNPANVRQTNTTSGFSIITYTGTGAVGTIAHGLGVAPRVIMVKNRGRVKDWCVYHASMGETKKIELNLAGAASDDNAVWNDTAPTSSVFTVGPADERTNANDDTYVAYVFAEVQGYSKFGGYTGNGNVDGPFVYTGFSPAFVIVRRFDSGNNWHMHDNKRVPHNSNNKTLYPNLNNVEATEDFDMLSGGFKLRESGGGYNADGGTYFYMAFAESPFVTSNGTPNNAI